MDEPYTFKSKYTLLSNSSKQSMEVKDIKLNKLRNDRYRSISFKGILSDADVVLSNNPNNEESNSTSDEDSEKIVGKISAKNEIIKEDLILQNSNMKFM